jgi:hypothetical protein
MGYRFSLERLKNSLKFRTNQALNAFSVHRNLIVKHPSLVTIFGSCRQDSLYKLFEVTEIRDGLTYPHSSGEILQVIKYVSDLSEMNDVPKYCFRNFQLGTKVKSRSRLVREFAKSEIVVIEISSRIAYKYGNLYLHHEWFDNPENGSITSLTRGEVEIHLETDSEIEENLLKALELCNGKRIILATHFTTYQSGSRFALVELIRQLGVKHKISVFDPSCLFELYDESLLVVQEKVLSHFTNFGHEIVGGRLENLILELTEAPPLIQVIENNPERRQLIGVHGIGDSIYGSLTIHQEARRQHRPSRVSISGHTFSSSLRSSVQDVVRPETVKGIFHENDFESFKTTSYCYTNKRPRFPISNTDRDFVRNFLLNLNQDAQSLIERVKKEIDLPKMYDVVHLRFGDEFAFESRINVEETTMFFEEILRLMVAEGINCSTNVLLTDSYTFQEFLNIQGFITVPGQIGHAGTSEISEEEIEKMVLDISILSNARMIFQASTYPWGSGFSKSIAEVFDIELKQLDSISRVLSHYRKVRAV